MSTIEEIWKGLKKPIIDEYKCRSYNKSNLYVIKNQKNICGILISDNKGLLEKEYKNILVLNKKSIRGPELLLKNCLIVLNKDKETNSIFIKSISTHFEDYTKDSYSSIDIQFALDRLEQITKNLKKKLNEIVGVWGELFFLKQILKDNNTSQKSEIINSWESPNGRAIIDFNFRELNTCIEVKTTLKQKREHHISDYNQVNSTVNYEGFLASILIKEDPNGDTCHDVLGNIKSMLNEDEKLLFSKRLKIRGKSLCNDKNFSFHLQDKGLVLVKFEDVPKPITSDNIFNIKWDILIEEGKSISYDLFINRFKV